MQLEGSYEFQSERELVWEALQDPNILGSVVPGGQGFEVTGENQYTGSLVIKIGPVQGTFQGQIRLSNVNAPESYNIEVEGKGAPGFVKATGGVRLEARGSQTHMDYTGQAQVGGRIASVGQRLLDSSARSIIRQSLDTLNEYLKIQTAQIQQSTTTPTPTSSNETAAVDSLNAPAKPAAMPTYKPPSQMRLAFNVAKDVFIDSVPPKYQRWLLAAVILLLIFIIWLATR